MDLLTAYSSDTDNENIRSSKNVGAVDDDDENAKEADSNIEKNESKQDATIANQENATINTLEKNENIETSPASTMAISRINRQYVNAAPEVSLDAKERNQAALDSALLALATTTSTGSSTSNTAQLNLPKDIMLRSAAQEIQPFESRSIIRTSVGALESKVAFDPTTFAMQRTSFARTGQAQAPTENGETIVRTTLGYDQNRLEKMADRQSQQRKRPRPEDNNKEQDALVNDSDDEVQYGIWGPPSREEQWVADNALSDLAKGGVEALAPEQLAEREYIQERNRQHGIAVEEKETESKLDRLLERKMSHLLPPKMSDDGPLEASTTFHGKTDHDYRGKSWIEPPAGLASIAKSDEPSDHRCFVPKKCVARLTGHKKGVHRIRLFPRTGHLLLSAGLDGECKVWSMAEKVCMRTYVGHRAAVRDVQFNHDGTKFVSASFDRYLRLWETETGAVLQTFTNRKVPYVVQFYPHDDNYFVVGCSDNKIVTYDATTAEITQEYNHHLAPVNAILFVEDNGTKMVSSSDDKKVLVWEWDIGVPIKYISDPSMHSIPSLTMHPSHQFFCGQSLDNTIVVFQAGNRFALQRKKKYSGHVVSGYACEIAISPDGQFLASGDGNGALFFWDWKKHKILQKYRAHNNGPAICTVWHPLEPSVVMTCGWDGQIKMWQ